jgi:hypothetical protein
VTIEIGVAQLVAFVNHICADCGQQAL